MGFLYKIKKGGAPTQFAIGAVLVFLVGTLAIGTAASAYPTDWGEPTIPTEGVGGAIVSCGNVSMPGLTADKYGFIVYAAKRYLSQNYTGLTDNNIEQIMSAKNYLQESSDAGDEAALIAVLWMESGFNPHAISTSGASGMGQFIYGTAFEPGFPEFVGGLDVYGGPDGTGTPWDGGPKYRIPNNTAGDSNFYDTLSDEQKQDVRFDAKRSIYASAHYLGNLMRKNGGDPMDAYFTYSGSNFSATNTVRNKYNELKSGGGCDVLNIIPSSGTVAGQSNHLIDFTGYGVTGYSEVRESPIQVIQQYGYNKKNMSSNKSAAPCDTNSYGCWRYEIFRPKDPATAAKIISAAEGAVGQEKLPDLGNGTSVTYSQSTKKCTTLVYYVMKHSGYPNFSGAGSSFSYGDSFEYLPTPPNGPGLTILPGDVVHFLVENPQTPDQKGWSFNRTNDQHWAIGTN